MNKISLFLLFTLNYLTSSQGFTNIVSTKPSLHKALNLRMCSINTSYILESLQNVTSSRRKFMQFASIPATLSILPSYANAQDTDDYWSKHNGQFSEDFLKDFTTTKSGLLYKDIKAGSGKKPNDGDSTTIEMVGYIFETGDKWCNTYKGIPAYQSVVRAGSRENQKFMKGLNEGVKTMQVGGKRILVIPAYLAYNYITIFSQENPNVVIIPGGSALVCYIEMLSFKPL
jgi:FKBP-type peptidyl-prolyl cis-trans isomerase